MRKWDAGQNFAVQSVCKHSFSHRKIERLGTDLLRRVSAPILFDTHSALDVRPDSAVDVRPDSAV
jgi:hypothetical protein